MRPPCVLPPSAKRFLSLPEHAAAEPVLRRFHAWLAAKRVAISGLEPAELERFFQQPFRRVIAPRSAQRYKRGLLLYLCWLHRRGSLAFNPNLLAIRLRAPLPPLALEYLEVRRPTLKPSTCNNLQSSLQAFHDWAKLAGPRIETLTRTQAEHWLTSLADAKLHASTRCGRINDIRSYLRWRYERGALEQDPAQLIRRRDYPKLPLYLPRPLPPALDAELQSRLDSCEHSLWRPLLLMRLTGLRIGELRSLDYDCLRVDPAGNRFLKVPLGKLDSERLVPLSPKAEQLVAALRVGRPRTYLISSRSQGRVDYAAFSRALREACEGLTDVTPITSHRLRHTYATSLLAAGASLATVMKLLGHRDYRMTLRYTAITDEHVRREYFEALGRIERRYLPATDSAAAASEEFDPLRSIEDLTSWIGKKLHRDHRAQKLIRRLQALRRALAAATT